YNFAIQGFGAVPGAQTFGTKFNDLNGDGVHDANEPGLAGWTIFGDLNENGTLDAGEPTTVTGADGSYVLPGLPGDRLTQVREVQQTGWRRTFPAAGYHVFNPFIDAIQVHDFGNTRGSRIAGRFVFYNASVFDGYNPGANADDDLTIAPDKAALLPGAAATFANVTSYSRGINGVMIDVELLGGVPDVNDFTFRTGSDAAGWVAAPNPDRIVVRGLGNGIDRVTLTWPDGAIVDRWLAVTVGATAHT